MARSEVGGGMSSISNVLYMPCPQNLELTSQQLWLYEWGTKCLQHVLMEALAVLMVRFGLKVRSDEKTGEDQWESGTCCSSCTASAAASDGGLWQPWRALRRVVVQGTKVDADEAEAAIEGLKTGRIWAMQSRCKQHLKGVTHMSWRYHAVAEPWKIAKSVCIQVASQRSAGLLTTTMPKILNDLSGALA